MNEEIRDKLVFVVTESGPLGRMSSIEARNEASNRKLDLVKISPNANPPVCKIMDFGKYCYEQKKKEKDAKKKQAVIRSKEIRLSARIGDGDLEFKANQARKFISDGNKVKVVLKMRGRENNNADLGISVIDKFCDLCSEFANPEAKPIHEGKQLIVNLKKNDVDGKKVKEVTTSTKSDASINVDHSQEEKTTSL